MLKRILIINSDIYGKAEINLDKINSLQLVGENNVGKSSLINTLNFLYIIDQRLMQFEGDRRLQDSLQHYFPTVQRSFILFEIVVDKHYCILVRRTPENQLEYYQVPHAYDPTWFFSEKEDKKEVNSFNQVLNQIKAQGIPLTKLSPLELYSKIYSQEMQDQPLVQLKSNVSRKGKSVYNHFTQIYKYLICSKRISEEDLTKSLLLAFDKADVQLEVFADTQNDSLEKLEKTRKKIEGLKSIATDFATLEESHQLYEDFRKKVGISYYNFGLHYPTQIKALKEHREEIDEKINAEQDKQETLMQELRILHQKTGELKSKIELKRARQLDYQKKLSHLATYETPLALGQLESQIQTLEKEKMALEQIIEKVTHAKDAQRNLSTQKKRLEGRLKALATQIKGFDDALIHHVTPNKKVQNLLTALLSPSVLYSPKGKIKRKIKTLQDEMPLFDGLIDIAHIQPREEFLTLQELQAQHKEVEKQLIATQRLEEDTDALAKIKESLSAKRKLREAIQDKPLLQKEEQTLDKEIKALEKESKTLAQAIKEKESSLKLHAQAQEKHKAEAIEYKHKKTLYDGYKVDLAQKSIIAIEEERAITTLEDTYQQLKKELQMRDEKNKQAHLLFEEIKKSLGGRYDDNRTQFIEEIRGQIDGLDQLIASEKELRKGVLNNFIQPTYSFLQSYEECKKKLKRFSEQLSDHQISGLHKIELHPNEITSVISHLEKIASVNQEGEFSFNPTEKEESLEIIKEYIASQKTFRLEDLFRLELRLTLQEGSRPMRIYMNKQIQSYGTDKVIRLIIFLQMLQEMIIATPKNPIVIYVDEVGTLGQDNIHKLLAFCKETNVLPIFAATKYIEGFEKYYPLIRNAENKVWIEDQHATLVRSLPKG